MGGTGSGRKWQRKETVDDSMTLSMKGLRRLGLLGERRWCTICWNWGDGSQSQIGVETAFDRRPAHIRLFYTSTGWDGQTRDYDYIVHMDADACRFGGCQWYFRCVNCNRRVRQLYLPGGGNYFACRHCHDLTYESAQTHDARMPNQRRDPDAFSRWLETAHADLRDGSKASFARGLRTLLHAEGATGG